MEFGKVKMLRRRLSLSSKSSMMTPSTMSPSMTTPERKTITCSSMESELENDSPLLPACADFDSPMDYSASKKCPGTMDSDMRRKLASSSSASPMRKKSLSPMLLFGNSPGFKPILNDGMNEKHSKNSIGFKPIMNLSMDEKHSDLSLFEMEDEVPDLDQNFPTKKIKLQPRPHSAPTVNMSLTEKVECFGNQYSGFSEEDGFYDSLCEGDTSSIMDANMPFSFMELIEAPIVNGVGAKGELKVKDKENSPPEVKSRNSPPEMNSGNSSPDHVFQQPSLLPLKMRSSSCSGKRCEPLSDRSPLKPKKKQRTMCGRSNSVYDGDPALWTLQPLQPLTSPRTLQRSQSFDSRNIKSPGVDITSLLDMDDKNLIGDKSKPYCLPTSSPSKQPDLKVITPDTLAAVIDNKFQEDIGKVIIVDCRYPYEYEGGHIRGAINIHEKQGIIDMFLRNPLCFKDKRLIIVFHCEFSLKRGPTLCRFLRNKDRDIHANFYPKLYYPEMYLLEGGYKQFFEKKREYCEPQGYRKMFDGQYQQELKLFTKRSKSWSEENSLRNRNRGKTQH